MNSIKSSLQKELEGVGWHSRGYLPHFDNGEKTQTINLRLGDSLPKAVLQRWKRELQKECVSRIDPTLRKRIDHYLDQGYGSCALRNQHIARIVQNSLLHFDGKRYRLSAWVIMPNHVHSLLTPCQPWSISEILKRLKSFTSREANKLLQRGGRFWMGDYFDRYVRNLKHYENAIAYIENNPVKAGLCKRPEDWPFSSAYFRANKH